VERYLKCECCGHITLDQNVGGDIPCQECVISGCKDYSFIEITEKEACKIIGDAPPDKRDLVQQYKASKLLNIYKDLYDKNGDASIMLVRRDISDDAVSQAPFSFMITQFEMLIDQYGDIDMLSIINQRNNTFEYVPVTPFRELVRKDEGK